MKLLIFLLLFISNAYAHHIVTDLEKSINSLYSLSGKAIPEKLEVHFNKVTRDDFIFTLMLNHQIYKEFLLIMR